MIFNHLYLWYYKDIFDQGAVDTIEKSGAGKVFETLFPIWIWSKPGSSISILLGSRCVNEMQLSFKTFSLQTEKESLDPEKYDILQNIMVWCVL